MGSTGLDGVISTQREQIAIATADRLQGLLDIYSSGINVVKINIEDARPPNEVKAAYDDVIEAREDLERYINDAQAYSNGIIPQARGEAQRLREEAEAYKSQVVSKAEGETERFVALLTECSSSDGGYQTMTTAGCCLQIFEHTHTPPPSQALRRS